MTHDLHTQSGTTDSAPPKASKMSIGALLDRIEQIAKIIAVAVAVFGVGKYYAEAKQKRIDKSQSYFDTYHEGAVFDSRHWIATRFYEIQTALGTVDPPPTADQLTAQIAAEFTSTPGVLHYDVVIEFFERVKSCIDNKGCDRGTALAYLSQEAEIMKFFLFAKIAERQSVNDRSSDALLCIAAKYELRGCEPE